MDKRLQQETHLMLKESLLKKMMTQNKKDDLGEFDNED
jgi:hypothetical protein